MDCRHYNTSDIRSGIKAAEADLGTIGVLLSTLSGHLDQDMISGMYRNAMAVRDLDMLINTVLLMSHRALVRAIGEELGGDIVATLNDSKAEARQALELVLTSHGIGKAIELGQEIDETVEALSFSRTEIDEALDALGAREATIVLTTCSVADHVEGIVCDYGSSVVHALREITDLIEMRQRLADRLHASDWAMGHHKTPDADAQRRMGM